MQIITKLVHGVYFTVLASGLFAAAGAQEFPIPKTHNHTLGSGPDVWRVELRQPNRYLTMTSGDNDGVNELNRLSVRLEGGNKQYHFFDESAPYLSLQANDLTHDYVEARVGSPIHLTRLTIRNRDGYNLWIHAKQRMQTGISRPTVDFKIKVRARELDCSRRRKCKRGDNGETTYFVNLETPVVRSNRCIPQNTYRITAVNGATMVLRPNSRSRETRTPRHEFNDDGPHMALQIGEICIASTSR